MAVTSLLKPRSIARKALSFYIQKAGSNQNAAFDFITYLADKLFKVKISEIDIEPNYLENKLVEGDYISIDKETDSEGVEILKISATEGGRKPNSIIFNIPSNLWEVNHYRGYRPVINITDLNGNVIDVDYKHLNDGQFVVTPADAITGIVTYY